MPVQEPSPRRKDHFLRRTMGSIWSGLRNATDKEKGKEKRKSFPPSIVLLIDVETVGTASVEGERRPA